MKQTPLHDAHVERGGRMGAFAGYDMPLFYGDGALAEHLWTRDKAGLFDVSHMGQVLIEGPNTDSFLNRLIPGDMATLAEGQARYTVLTNDQGGIVDDLIVTRLGPQRLLAVVNAGTKDKDFAWFEAHRVTGVTLNNWEDRALLALQGPLAEQALRAALRIDAGALPYMAAMTARLPDGAEVLVSRLGYTGEDGFELSLPESAAAATWRLLTGLEAVRPVGLAARDTLRLEMGYPLYGHDIDETTTPVEANLSWIIAKTNRGFMGADVILGQREHGCDRLRRGLRLTAPGVAREGAEIVDGDGAPLGRLTSGGYAPSLKVSIGMGYVPPTATGTAAVRVRGRDLAAAFVKLPFVPASTRTGH